MPTSSRQLLTGMLDAALPGDVTFLPYYREIDPPEASTVMLRLDGVDPSGVIGHRRYRYSLVLIAAKAATATGDDELEALLEDVLYVLEKDHTAGLALTWAPATRGVYPISNPTQPAFEIPITATFQKQEPA